MNANTTLKPRHFSVLAILPWLTLLTIWLITRADTYAVAKGLYTNNPDWSYYFFPAGYLHKHPFNAFFYLRSNPPLPQLVFFFLQKIFTWPFQIPVIQLTASLMSLISASLLMKLTHTFWRYPAACLIAILYITNNDLISFEVSGYANAFYEIMGAMIIILSAFMIYRNSKWIGAAIAAIVFTKAAFTYLPIAGLIGALLTRHRQLAKIFSVILVALIILSIKNLLIYKEYTFETSISTGFNILNRLWQTKTIKDFYKYTKETGNTTCLIDTQVTKYKFDFYCPEFNEKRNVELGKKIDCLITNDHGEQEFCSLSNSGLMFELSRQLRPRYLEYSLHNPRIFLSTISTSYIRFWGFGSNHLDTHDKIAKIRPWPIERLQQYFLYLNMSVFNTLVLVLALVILFRKNNTRNHTVFIFSIGICLYYILVTSIGDCCENTRFRQAVMPMIIFCNCYALNEVLIYIFHKYSHSKNRKPP